MLAQAAAKFDGDRRVTLLWTPAERLPFPDNTFDVVTCLEALEFMVDTKAVLREIVRVLRPSGLLLITNRINTRMMPGKTMPDAELLALLESFGIVNTTVDVWQVDYNRVWGKKAGTSPPTLARPLAEIMHCPRCDAVLMVEQGDGWTCPNCHFRAPVMADGVVELGAR
jgi:SAM-dependent methyltransferase